MKMGGFLNTAFGVYVNKIAKLSNDNVMRNAYTDSVLAQMSDLNQKQLDEGLYSDGTDTPDYSPFTIEIKKAKGQIWEHMTFKDTGETRDSITYRYRGGRLQVEMNDRFDLMRDYSPNIIGLTSGSIADVQDEIAENIQEMFLPNN